MDFEKHFVADRTKGDEVTVHKYVVPCFGVELVERSDEENAELVLSLRKGGGVETIGLELDGEQEALIERFSRDWSNDLKEGDMEDDHE